MRPLPILSIVGLALATAVAPATASPLAPGPSAMTSAVDSPVVRVDDDDDDSRSVKRRRAPAPHYRVGDDDDDDGHRRRYVPRRPHLETPGRPARKVVPRRLRGDSDDDD